MMTLTEPLLPLKTTACDGCGWSIVWAETVNQKRMPLDADPKELTAGFKLEENGPGSGRYHCRHMKAPEPILLHESHWATCPKADQFRR